MTKPVLKLVQEPPQYLLDAQTLDAGQLRDKYPVEVKAYDNAKHRAKKDGEEFTFESFGDLLRKSGPTEVPTCRSTGSTTVRDTCRATSVGRTSTLRPTTAAIR